MVRNVAPLAEATLLKHRAMCSTLSSTETLHIARLLAQHTEQTVDEKQELKTNLGCTVNFTYEKKLDLSSAESVGSSMDSWVPCSSQHSEDSGKGSGVSSAQQVRDQPGLYENLAEMKEEITTLQYPSQGLGLDINNGRRILQ